MNLRKTIHLFITCIIIWSIFNSWQCFSMRYFPPKNIHPGATSNKLYNTDDLQYPREKMGSHFGTLCKFSKATKPIFKKINF